MYGYYNCIAAGQSGSHGVDVAISKTCPFAVDADGDKVFVEREHVSVLVSDPRCIIVRVCSKALEFYVSSAHVPFLGSTTDHKKCWAFFFQKQHQEYLYISQTGVTWHRYQQSNL